MQSVLEAGSSFNATSGAISPRREELVAALVVNGTPDDDRISIQQGPVEIFGFAGNDLLRAFSGAVTLSGGTGDDAYYVYEAGTAIIEAESEGTDRVYTSIDLTIPENVEYAAAEGSEDLNLTGNELTNYIRGNAGANQILGGAGTDVLLGLGGDDVIDGGLNADSLEGGSGNDIFVMPSGGETDRIGDFVPGEDLIDLSNAGTSFEFLEFSSVGTGTFISHDGGSFFVSNLLTRDIDRSLFLSSPENAPVLERVEGTSDGDKLSVNSGPVQLLGFGGDDLLRVFDGFGRLVGGTGDDVYQVFDSFTEIIEEAGEGYDRVYTTVEYTLPENVEFGAIRDSVLLGTALRGNNSDNFLVGSDKNDGLVGDTGNDRLRGRDGIDFIIGGEGNDVLEGGADPDFFSFQPGDGLDLVLDFNPSEDFIEFFDDAANPVNVQFIEIGGRAAIDYGSGTILFDALSLEELEAATIFINFA